LNLSQFKAETKTSIIFSSFVLEHEGKTIGSRRSKTRDKVGVFEFDCISLIIALFEGNALIVKEHTVEFDRKIN
jgi:hypothetical protein